MFSFTHEGGGVLFNPGSAILHIINRVNQPITDICIAWSAATPSKDCTIEIKDHTGALIQTLSMGPAPSATSKNIYEHSLTPITTSFTRLLKFITKGKVIIYSISVEN
jgi:hypothetical protein